MVPTIRDKRMTEKISNKRIFVVDDDMPSFQLIEEIFASYKVTLEYFGSGKEFLQTISKDNLPDLIIMDIQLPDDDGLELTQEVKKIDPSVPVIAYTSYAMAGDRERCIQAGCSAYISKPINLDAFLDTVSRHI